MTITGFTFLKASLFFIYPYLQSIIFIRDKNAKGQEISGYIDFAHRLKVHIHVDIVASTPGLFPALQFAH